MDLLLRGRPLHSRSLDVAATQREDGRVGTRNYIAIVAASNCAAHTAELVADSFAGETLPPNVDGVVAFPHGEGCGHSIGPDTDQLKRTLWGVLDHPNVSGAVVLGLGCEVNQIDHYVGGSAPRKSDRIIGMTIQNTGGTRATVEACGQGVGRLIFAVFAWCSTTRTGGTPKLGSRCPSCDQFPHAKLAKYLLFTFPPLRLFFLCQI